MFIYDHLNSTKRLDCNMTLLRNYKRSVLPFLSVYKNTTAVSKINLDFELVVYPKQVKNFTFIELKGAQIVHVPFR